MKTYTDLEKEFEDKVKKLQSKCKHQKTTWCQQMWAMGHFSGYKVRICDICNKRLEEEPTKEEREKVRAKEVECWKGVKDVKKK